jgi:chromosome segregation ATPase
MSTYDARLNAVEKDVTRMKQDIAYKLDDINHNMTMIRGVAGKQGNDIRVISTRLDGIDTRLARLEEWQNEQGQDIRDIKRHLDGTDQHLEGIDQRFVSLEGKVDQVLHLLTFLTTKTDE